MLKLKKCARFFKKFRMDQICQIFFIIIFVRNLFLFFCRFLKLKRRCQYKNISLNNMIFYFKMKQDRTASMAQFSSSPYKQDTNITTPPIYLLISHQKVAKTTTWGIFFKFPFSNFYSMFHQIIYYQGDSRIAYVREMSACICYPPPLPRLTNRWFNN